MSVLNNNSSKMAILKKRRTMKIIIILLLLMTSCKKDSNLNDIFDQNIRVKLNDDKLQIENLVEEDLYYIVLNDVSITYTDWRPFIKDFTAKIAGESLIEISPERTEGMKSYIIYYWFKSDDIDKNGIADKSNSVRLVL